ncbi:AbrB family transcriptional regulator [Lyngbya confervoides]|uniref:AbrB family transcriptional regulator n=1 Tax=Lyngbya confervoides BDU141951 TaxID=1574623 RepID=A0ABD4T5N4_9CYAN|nr:AbrB family transcriptional regulator [Lyngbya confervoides]MCM1983741.1 AbrB family transcriptional regulator [Lyngbya confervoides BDU141951]
MPRKAKSKSQEPSRPRLTGKQLLREVKKLKGFNKSGKAKACGYVTQTQEGKERVHLAEFMNALLEAKGIELDGENAPRRGRGLSYRASVQRNGTVIIGAGYTREMGIEPGAVFEIKTGRKRIQLLLAEADNDDETEFEDEDGFDEDEID